MLLNEVIIISHTQNTPWQTIFMDPDVSELM